MPKRTGKERERHRLYMRKWYASHPGYQTIAYNQKLKRAKLLKRYGLTIEQYDAMFEHQNRVCAICLEAPKETLGVDHEHATGEVRGLLCFRCNIGLGYYRDSPLLLASAIRYLNARLKK